MKLNPEDQPTDYYAYDNECQKCGSTNVFKTFDGVMVCRYCGHTERIHARPVNLITHNLVWEHERAEKAKRKVEAHNEAVDLQEMVKSIFRI